MIKLFPKNINHYITPNLSVKEIQCKCAYSNCKHAIVVTELADRFEQLRMLCGDIPLWISSGNRCAQHNADSGGAALSQHLIGFALDIYKPKGINLFDFEQLALDAGFSYVLPYPSIERLHCDIRGQI